MNLSSVNANRAFNFGGDGGGGGGGSYGGGGGSYGGGGTTTDPDWLSPLLENVPNSEYKNEKATCRVDQEIRHSHATQDMNALWSTRSVWNKPRAGLYTFNYEDGGTEIWWYWGGAGDAVLYPIPKQNSLRCP